jgi:hypothetical protein
VQQGGTKSKPAFLATERARHQRELEEAVKAAEAAATKKTSEDAAQRETALRAEAAEEKERSRKLLTQLAADEARTKAETEYRLELQDREKQLARALEEAGQRERSFKVQLAAAEDRIKAEARKNADDEYTLKLREKDKQLADAWQKVKEAEAKMQQGSQQAQGEALELEIEEILREAFRDDEISEVKKGQRGADTVQKVIDRKGRLCGTILWESKNAQWSETWLPKLRADQRAAKAQIAVLVTTNPPAGCDTFLHRDGIWIVKRRFARDLASLLRHSLIAVYAERANQAGKDEKMEILYGYLTSVEFQYRVQAIVEGFTYLLDDVEREKRWFETKWARQEKEIRKIIDSTQGMYGDLQAVTDRSLPTIAALELPEATGLPPHDGGAVSV